MSELIAVADRFEREMRRAFLRDGSIPDRREVLVSQAEAAGFARART